jgi:hypothetical protein
MVRPECFKAPYVTLRNVPYSPVGTWPTDKSIDGGVLAKGQTVWLKCTRERESVDTLVPAFVEHLGSILVDARFLIDLGQHVTSSLQKWRGGSPVDPKNTMTIVPPSQNNAGRREHFLWQRSASAFRLLQALAIMHRG